MHMGDSKQVATQAKEECQTVNVHDHNIVPACDPVNKYF